MPQDTQSEDDARKRHWVKEDYCTVRVYYCTAMRQYRETEHCFAYGEDRGNLRSVLHTPFVRLTSLVIANKSYPSLEGLSTPLVFVGASLALCPLGFAGVSSFHDFKTPTE